MTTKVLILSPEYPPYSFGGAGIDLKMLANFLSKRKYNVTVVSGRTRRPSEIKIVYKNEKLEIIRVWFPDKPKREIWYSFLNRDILIRLVDKYDIVISNSCTISPLLGSIRYARKPIIIRVHGIPPDSLLVYFNLVSTKDKIEFFDLDVAYYMELPLLRKMFVYDLIYSDQLIFVAYHTFYSSFRYLHKKHFSKLYQKSHIIYNGIDIDTIKKVFLQTQSIKSRSKSKIILGYVGRLFLTKGLPYVLKVFDTIVNDMKEKNVSLWIFGRGPLYRNMIRFIKKRKLNDKVLIFGYLPRNKLLKLMTNLDVLVFPSLYEGCPNTVLESFALGVPVVSFDLPWSKEFIVNGINGYRSPFPDIDKMAKLIFKSLSLDKEKIHAYAERYNIRYTLEKYAKLINDIT